MDNYLINKDKLVSFIVKDFEKYKGRRMPEMDLQKRLFYIHYNLIYDILKISIENDKYIELKTFNDNFETSMYGTVDRDLLKKYNNEDPYNSRKYIDFDVELDDIFNDLNDDRVGLCKKSILNTLNEVRGVDALSLVYFILDLDVYKEVSKRDDKRITLDDMLKEFLRT